ncbi:hypothetical protein Abu_1345 [Aliarcobacter butzleri RM4018]|uniref:Uncharacterized protein n=1 Tax=Aliarcobacter butzleri (strain RM4018) TaxID=367737 RepID=A8EUH7_ALIB4|nr:hypothetical protein [Aliarcobacter butzleri]ABV67601.1 hypothetical protein Abu_1345 [Aliarcobacter butzleri RM4018]GGT74802.1 hypothetical protein GCM10007985_08430 [Aliarcobacter butzleri]SNV29503.1 Uncharacterised protein [Aliarcobacter butzleri]
MSKIVLDEKEVNELMDSFDFQKSIYLQKLEKITNKIEKLQEIQDKQKQLAEKMEVYLEIIQKFQFQDENEMIKNYSVYLSFLAQKIEDLNKNQDLKKIERIINISNKLVSLSVVKVTAIVAVITTGINFIILK